VPVNPSVFVGEVPGSRLWPFLSGGAGANRYDEPHAVKSLPVVPRQYVFRFPHLSTVVQVEVIGNAITIRASADTFSRRRKISFLRELVAEGFIPDEYQWSSLSALRSDYPIVWLVDRSGFEVVGENLASRRLAIRLFAATSLIVALLMGMLFTGHLGNFRVGQSSPVVETLRP
jgi:hypothetical protein